jgi:hypothetical protein
MGLDDELWTEEEWTNLVDLKILLMKKRKETTLIKIVVHDAVNPSLLSHLLYLRR